MRRFRFGSSGGRVWLMGSIFVVLLGVFVNGSAMAQGAAGFAQRLSNLRAEVEKLAQELSAKSTETADQLRSLSRQKADLELELKREQTRNQKVQAAIAERRKEIQEEKAKGDLLVPLFKQSAEEVKQYIDSSLPFRRQERLKAVSGLQEQYEQGLLTPERALGRLWSALEDEFRMTRESGLFQQTITVDGKEQLADVVRIGMVTMYYKTQDGVGYVSRQGDGWVFKPIVGPDDQKLVLDLFTSFKKQIRVGYFELPGTLPGVGGEK